MTAFFAYAGAACSAVLAILAAMHARRSVVRWAFAAGMLVLTLEQIFAWWATTGTSPAAVREWQTWRLVVSALLPGTWLLFSSRYARAGDAGATPGVRAGVAVAFVLPAALVSAFSRELVMFTPAGSPHQWTLRLGWPGTVLDALLLIGSIWVVLNLERTFRASVGTLRWRIKFMLLGVGVLFVTRIYTSSQALLFRGLDPTLDLVNSAALVAATPLLLRSFFRAGHFDTQVYPSQAVLQSSVTVVLAGIYLLILAVFARAAAYLGGNTAFALKALLVLLAVVALAVLIQSDRVRLRLRRFVSRHFRRPLYDYRLCWKQFTHATASRVEQTDLSHSLVTLIAETFDALSVTLWLVDERDHALTLIASTSGNARGAGAHRQPEAGEVVAHFQKHAGPVDIDSESGPWAAVLRQCHPAEFTNGGHRVTVPLVDRGMILGVIVVGDRVNGVPFSCDDFELLECIAAHAAASLGNARLSQSLSQLRQFEAFQSMAAFFVHDLKNAASTLTLMLQNLPVHFDNPAFRADALRAIASTTTHINGLIGRLSLLRHELKIELRESDLNQVITDAIAGLESAPGATLVREMHPVPRIPLDPEQLKKVVINLILNAAEAAPSAGRIRVATSQQEGWVVLTVNDNGCGMTRDFLTQSLFRPFQTTKKNGLGIGMFQSKMIVEAHGGRIAVESEPGKGTTFHVFLRAPAAGGRKALRSESIRRPANEASTFIPTPAPAQPTP